VNPMIAAIGVFVTSCVFGHVGELGEFGDLPQAQPIVTWQSLRDSVEVREAVARVEAMHHVRCLDVQPGRFDLFLLWTVQWSTAHCPVVDAPERSLRVTFRFVQGPSGAVRLRATRVHASGD